MGFRRMGFALAAAALGCVLLPAAAAMGQAGAAAAQPASDPEVRKLASELADKGWILFAAKAEGQWDLYLARPDGSGMRNITNTPAYNEIGGRFSPDSRRILYRRFPRAGEFDNGRWGERGELIIANSDGSNPETQVRGRDLPWASWSPDGKQLACLYRREGKVRIVDVATKRNVRELPAGGIFIQLYWSPDGTKFCGTANVAGMDWNILVLDALTGKSTLVSREINCTSDWFRDSARVIHSHRDERLDPTDPYGVTSLWQATADGQNRSLIYGERGQHIYFGKTSPDDKYVIFTRHVDDMQILCELGVMRLSDAPVVVDYPPLKQLFPNAKSGPVLWLSQLPKAFEPDWTYVDVLHPTTATAPAAATTKPVARRP